MKFPLGILALLSIPALTFSETFVSGATTFNIGYEDGTLTESEKTAICIDVKQYRTFWTNFVVAIADEASGTGYLVERNVALSPIQRKGVKMPRKFHRDQTGALTLQVEQSLSNHYKDAFLWKDANTNKVEAAERFVAFLDGDSLSATPWTDLANIYYQSHVSTNLHQRHYAAILAEIGRFTYSTPSVLSYQDVDLSRFGLTGAGTLAFLPCIEKNPSGSPQLFAFPILWFDNRWHLIPDTP